MDRTRCLATNHEGQPCQSRPVRPSGYCFWHDPALEEQRREWSRKGGANRSNKARAKKELPAALLTTEEIQSWLGIVFKGVIGGKIEPGIGNAAANLAKAMTTIREAAEMEARFEALEKAVGIDRDRRLA